MSHTYSQPVLSALLEVLATNKLQPTLEKSHVKWLEIMINGIGRKVLSEQIAERNGSTHEVA